MSADEASIDQGVRELANAFTAGDPDAVASLFSSDYVTLPPNEPICVGLAAVRKWHAAIFQQFSGIADLQTAEVVIDGNHAYARGSYAMELGTLDEQSVRDTGKFVMVWKRQTDGSWRIKYNMWNSDGPPA